MTDGTFPAILPEVARRVAHNSQWLESKTLAAVQSLRAAAFFTSSNWVISTVPSGNLAVIFSSPPHGFDEIVKRAYVHIRAALELGYSASAAKAELKTEQLPQR